ncbi:MAG TPA: Gfo/Idh/MocA family oxidoreductase [Phycisphaerae bacterium]|nr:Gfo/Idh/MocA family oxidoreductase [Phycisphaerae bacterium]
MKRITRRSFVKKGSLAAGAAVALSPWARVLGANGDVRVGVVGFRSQGGYHIKLLRELPGVRVVALCDPDRDVLGRQVKSFAGDKQKVDGYADVRKMLEDKDLDAITTATPDHWHALVTIWACQAGKDVYVEKPLCHNLWEGRKMVEAARKHKRIVQFGNQNHGQKTGQTRLEMGDLGKILVVHTSLNRMRKSIGKVPGPQAVPESLDYDLWTGPAPLEPLRRKNLHYDWHWVWPTGTGELGNNGVYPLDACRLALGQGVLPRRVMCFGGRFLFDDDGQTPNTQVCLFQYEPGPLVIFELRNLPSEKGPKTLPTKMKCERGESKLPSPTGKAGETGGFGAHKGHLFNFLSAVRSRKVSDLRADVLEGHLSTALVHMGNISYRLGTPHSPEEAREAIADRGSDATEALARCQEHLAANGVDWSKGRFIVGPWLEMDRQAERFVGSSKVVAQANELVKPPYRKPFVVPDEV